MKQKASRIFKRLFIGLVVVHFGLMALGMVKLHVPQDHWAVKAVRWYASLTGSGVGFGFFSPDIPQQVVLDFDVAEPDGHVLRTSLQDSASNDVSLRLGNMIRMMASTYKDEKVYRAIAASLTASIYRRYPEAKAITLHASVYQFPDMASYRDGLRPDLEEVYSAKFAKRN